MSDPNHWLHVLFPLLLLVYVHSQQDMYGHDISMIGESRWGSIGIDRPQCIDIPDSLSVCKGMGYKQMSLPNLLDHSSLPEVVQQFSSSHWRHLIGRKCHPDTRLFLCSLFTPVCLDRKIYPCRSLCSIVKEGCEGIMQQWGYPWPDMLNCSKFPLQNDLCIYPQHTDSDNVCPPCKEPDTFEGLVDSFCRADAVFRITVDSTEAESDGYLRINFLRKKRAYKRGTLSKKEIRKLVGYIENGAQCECLRNNETMIAPKSRLLVMGRRVKNRFVLFFVSPYQRKSEGFRKATKMWKKDSMCKTVVIPDVYIERPPEMEEKPTVETEEKKKRKSRRKKDKNKKKRKKGSRKNKDGTKRKRKNKKRKEPTN